MQSPQIIDSPIRHWKAQLNLQLTALDGRTRLTGNRHQGPLRVQRPFHPEANGCCHIYLLHPPGGLVSGDDVGIDVETGPAAHGLLTTPSSGKVYRGAPTGEWQHQTTRLRLGAGAQLEWLPQDTIVFDGARVALDLQVDLQADSRFIGWEMVCLGRPAGGFPFRSGSVVQTLRIMRDGHPLLIERMPLEGGADAMTAPWGLDDHGVFTTLIAQLDHLGEADRDQLLRDTRAELEPLPRAGATITRELLLVRALASDAQQVRTTLQTLWVRMRPAVIGAAPCPPRIWTT
ncbi:urease accessory protein UreD [Marinobacteraceae bacterium S3BR75-40.1]